MHILLSKNKDSEKIIHYLMCLIGGFFGSYALLSRGNFGSAQTANLINLFINLGASDFLDAVLRLLALIAFVLLLVISTFIREKFDEESMKYCILVEIMGVILIGFIPSRINELLALLPLFALSAFQWGIFSGTKEYNSSTLFSTGNIRECINSWVGYRRQKMNSHFKSKLKPKAVFYTATLLYYHIGVVFGIYLVTLFDIKSILFCIIPLIYAFYITQQVEQT